MKFGYTILYVDDVEQAVAFYERAFGLKRKMVMAGEYGELATGATRLGFADKAFAGKLSGAKIQSAGVEHAAPPVEIAFVTDDVDGAYATALAAGASAVKAPADKPWGQRVGYVRDNNGFLVELCTAVE